MKTIAFFNNKGGVGKTSLVYHLAWMFAEEGQRVLAVDLDPQANLTAMMLSEEDLESFWPLDGRHEKTILGAIDPIMRGVGDIANCPPMKIDDSIALLVGDLGLSAFEDRLSYNWSVTPDQGEAAFRVVSSFYRLMQKAGREFGADILLVDVGPNLGAINRVALVSSDFVVVPLAPDLFSLQGLRNLGPTLRDWRNEWRLRLDSTKRPPDLELPLGTMKPSGYIVMQHAVRLDRPVKAYRRWLIRIPSEYARSVLLSKASTGLLVESDHNCLGLLKHYRSLMPLAIEARKPMFLLKPADGAIGAHQEAVMQCRLDFSALAKRIQETTEGGPVDRSRKTAP